MANIATPYIQARGQGRTQPVLHEKIDHIIMLAAQWLTSHATMGWLLTTQEQADGTATTLDQIRASNGAISRMWHSPPDRTSTSGLGGGLTFAYDRKICDDLLPSMSEASGLWGTSFVDCDSIFAAIRSAFASWSSNHPSIKFHDVTADCLAKGDETGGPLGRGCSRAEIFLTSGSKNSSSGEQDAAATTQNQFAWVPEFHHPNGRIATSGVYATVGSIISFTADAYNPTSRSHYNSATPICWYIDSSFCSGFHELKRSVRAENVLLIGKLVIFVIWGLGLVWSLAVMYSFITKTNHLLALERAKASRAMLKRVQSALAQFDRDRDGSLSREELRSMVQQLKRPEAPDWSEEQLTKLEQRFQERKQAVVMKTLEKVTGVDFDGDGEIGEGGGEPRRGEPTEGAADGSRSRVKRLTGKKLEAELEKVIAELDATHHALSEEGSIEWKLAFERVSKLNLAPVACLLMLVVCPIIFYVLIFLPCWCAQASYATPRHLTWVLLECSRVCARHFHPRAQGVLRLYGRGDARDRSRAWPHTSRLRRQVRAQLLLPPRASSEPRVLQCLRARPSVQCPQGQLHPPVAERRAVAQLDHRDEPKDCQRAPRRHRGSRPVCRLTV